MYYVGFVARVEKWYSCSSIDENTKMENQTWEKVWAKLERPETECLSSREDVIN